MTEIRSPASDGEVSDWTEVFGPDEPVLWAGAPYRIRLVAWNLCMIVAALILLAPFLSDAGLSAKVALLAGFATVLTAWRRILRVSTWRYAVTDRHVAIRREGLGAGWMKYPLQSHFLQPVFGGIRIFTVSPGHNQRPPRLSHLTRAERAAALLAARQVPRRRFTLSRKALAQDFETLLPHLLCGAGVPDTERPPLVWTGHPSSPPMVMPMFIGGAAAIALLGAALIAGVMGNPTVAVLSALGSGVAAFAERGWFRWETTRKGAARYALAGAYAIQIVPGLPFLPGRCDIRRISGCSPLIVDTTDVGYGFECFLTRMGWTVGTVAFHKPTDAARLIEHLRRIAAADPRCAPM